MLLDILLTGTNISLNGIKPIDISGIFLNSKDVISKSLFFAVKGCNENGEKYINEAIKNGASIILSENKLLKSDDKTIFLYSNDLRRDISIISKNFYCACDEKLKIIAITGTNGKTSTQKALTSIFTEAGKKTGYAGTISTGWGNYIENSHLTTPDSVSLHRYFFEMVKSSCEYCVIEASSQGIHQKRLNGINFYAKILTNISQDHLDYHKTMDEYKKVKAQFIEEGIGLKILNLNEPLSIELLKNIKNVFTYAVSNKKADLNAEILLASLDGSLVRFYYNGDIIEILIRNVFGFFMIENITAAVLVALKSGISFNIIRSALENFIPPFGRMTFFENKFNFNIVVDYAHTPHALQSVLLELKKIKKQRLIVLFGCGGNRDKEKRAIMGSIANDLADIVYVTSDNPRNEKPIEIINQIISGISEKNKYRVVEDRGIAIIKALNEMRSNDILLIAGKGHEDYQEIEGKKFPFSDFDVLSDFFVKKGDLK